MITVIVHTLALYAAGEHHEFQCSLTDFDDLRLLFPVRQKLRPRQFGQNLLFDGILGEGVGLPEDNAGHKILEICGGLDVCSCSDLAHRLHHFPVFSYLGLR
ncbi:hypothetical protein [Flintibacter muris]|uniref:hypothetical protein n=1 Tax=Flintibacter muris TaxID=2941327 RepID=UPI00203D317D|nr:hypothetical protein [Flintibacter muris]